VIAGDIAGHEGPGQTHTPMTMAHATVSPGSRVDLPWDPAFNALAYVLSGAGSIGAERRPIAAGQLAVLGPGDVVRLEAAAAQEARAPALEVLVLGGRPIREPVAWYGPFVMNTRDEIVQAVEDYQAGRLGAIPAAHHTPDQVVESSPTDGSERS
jgi:quercetin 2,3-dioxygenase